MWQKLFISLCFNPIPPKSMGAPALFLRWTKGGKNCFQGESKTLKKSPALSICMETGRLFLIGFTQIRRGRGWQGQDNFTLEPNAPLTSRSAPLPKSLNNDLQCNTAVLLAITTNVCVCIFTYMYNSCKIITFFQITAYNN